MKGALDVPRVSSFLKFLLSLCLEEFGKNLTLFEVLKAMDDRFVAF